MNLAWYAAYGSNNDESRFRQYLDGCSEPTEPVDSRPFVLDLPLYFAGTTSRRWGDGGVAFASTERDPTPRTLGRAWLLPVARIAEIGAQENGLALDAATFGIDEVAFPGRWYDAWVGCGVIDGHPVVTLTSSTAREPRNPPSRRYCEVVARGIRRTHGLDAEQVARYLSERTDLPVPTLLAWQAEGPG